MTECASIIEDAGFNFAAHALDVPGCVAAADTIEATRRLRVEALELHLEMLRDMGRPISTPHVRATVVAVAN